MKEDEYTKILDKNQVCAIFQKINYLEKHFTQIYKALYGNAMLVSLMAAGRQQEPLFSSFSTNA